MSCDGAERSRRPVSLREPPARATRTIVTAAVAPLVGLVGFVGLTGCSGGQATLSSQTTSEVNVAEPAPRPTTGADLRDGLFEATEFPSESARFSLRVDSSDKTYSYTLDGTVDFPGARLGGIRRSSFEGQPIVEEIRLVEGILYARPRDVDIPWQQAPVTGDISLGPLLSFFGGDALVGRVMLEEVGQMKRIADETIRGDRTTHLFVGPSRVESADADAGTDSKAGGRVVEQHVWIDDHERVRKVELKINNVPAASGKVVSSLKLSVEMFDFGTEVDVVAPRLAPLTLPPAISEPADADAVDPDAATTDAADPLAGQPAVLTSDGR